jgi:capsular exopolysaccharide synthesis family protein
VFTSENRSVDEEALKQIQAQLTAARAERISRESVYESSRSRQPEALPEVLDSGPMRQYQVEISQLKQERAELSSNLTAAHPKIKKVDAQIRELEAVQKKERSNILSRIRIEYEAALKRERQLTAEYNKLAEQIAGKTDERTRYQTLLREVEIHRQLYETAMQKAKEASVASALNTSSVHVVDRARVPLSSSKPNLLANIPLGLFAGATFGVLLILVRERSDVSIHAPGSLPVHLSLRELGVIPAARTDPDTRQLDPRSNRLLGDSSPGTNSGEQLALVSWNRRPSMMAEAFRTTMASILFSGEGGSISRRVILFTSPSANEGKSTVVSNLGIALAEINYRVVLIDSDMRRPRLHQVFNVANSWGLSDLLYDRIAVDDYPREALVRKTDIPGLHLIPSGPARVSISSLLYSPRLQHLLRRLTNDFDIVLIDTSPVLSVSDARIIGRVVDAVVVVLRAGQTSRDAAMAAVRSFEEDGTAVLGTILNDWNPNASHTSLKYSRYV